MARIRTIKPEFWSDEKLAECTRDARLLFIGMWNFADDEGRMAYSSKRLKMQVFPGDNLDVAPLVYELSEHKLVVLYQVGNRDYLAIPNFRKHQRVDHPQSSTIPVPQSVDSQNEQGTVQEQSRNPQLTPVPEGNGKEWNGNKTLFSDSKTNSDCVSTLPRKKKTHKTPIPDNFAISDGVRKWAAAHGYSNLEERFEHFVGVAKAKGYTYADWDQAFQNAVRADWARLNGKSMGNGGNAQAKPISAVEQIRKSLGIPIRVGPIQ